MVHENHLQREPDLYLCFLSVCDEHFDYKDAKLLYRFRKDDGTFPLNKDVKVFLRGQSLYETYVRPFVHPVSKTCCPMMPTKDARCTPLPTTVSWCPQVPGACHCPVVSSAHWCLLPIAQPCPGPKNILKILTGSF